MRVPQQGRLGKAVMTLAITVAMLPATLSAQSAQSVQSIQLKKPNIVPVRVPDR